MPSTNRTFIALEVPEERRVKLGRLQSLVAPEVPGARWVDPSQFHVTMAFLGEVENVDLDGVCRAVAEAAAGHPPLQLRLDGLGVFTEAQPRTVWVGLAGDLEALAALQKEIAEAAKRAGYPPDDRFSPHVTIGRVKVGRAAAPVGDLGPLLRHYRGWSAGSFRVAEVVTFSSTLTPDGPVYPPLARAPLRARKTVMPP